MLGVGNCWWTHLWQSDKGIEDTQEEKGREMMRQGANRTTGRLDGVLSQGTKSIEDP